jgi:hypothetical protein
MAGSNSGIVNGNWQVTVYFSNDVTFNYLLVPYE